jgi:hypothetical protein
MLSLLLAAIVQGYSTPTLLPRIDRSSALSNDFTIEYFEPKYQQPSKLQESSDKPAFLFEFSCDGASIGQDRCELAKTGFENAGKRIASALDIKETIIVQALFHSFCSSQRNANCRDANNTLGRASGAAYFPASRIGSKDVYFYSQSLVKQLKKNSDVHYAKADIFAEFNSDFNFWFQGSGVPIKQNDTDFEFVVLHELTHGLGFESAWVQYSGYYTMLTRNAGYLAPLPFAQGSSDQSAIVSTFSPLSIFDSFLRSTTDFATLGREILKYRPKDIRLPDFISGFESSPQFANARLAMTGATGGTDALRFQPVNGQSISLHSPSRFQQGTSISHVDSRLATTPDFLMIPAITPLVGQRLDQIMASVNASSIYGPGTMAIMSAIGWPTKQSPEPIAITIASDYISSKSSAPATIPKWLGFFILYLCLTCF